MTMKWNIIQGDCVEGMKSIPSGSVHTCVTSPPYFGLRNYDGGAHEIGCEQSPEDYVRKIVEVFRGVKNILRDDGTLWLNIGDSYASTFRGGEYGIKAKDLIGIPWRVAFALQADGWYLRQDIIWNKPNPMPESVEDRCTKAHEYIFLLSKNPKYYYDHEAIKEPARNWGTRDRSEMRDGTTDPKLKHHGLAGKEWEENPMKNKRSVWTVTTKAYKGAHFATFPKDLIEPCVLAGCPKGGTVLDPFTGSGTTAVVSLNHGRNFVGTELNPEYIRIAENRIKEEVKTNLMEIME